MADPRLNHFMNPVRPQWRIDLYWILHWTLVKFIFMVLVIFSVYAVIFAVNWAQAPSCIEIWQYRGESEYWLENCIEKRGENPVRLRDQ